MITYDNNDICRSEGEVAETLAVFDADYVFRLIDSHIQRRFDKHFVPLPNIVHSFKMVFNNIKIQFPSDTENTNIKEEEVYDEIIRTVCERCNLTFNAEQVTATKYAIAATVYDVAVINFSDYFIDFLFNTVVKEKENIYAFLNENNLIREKDCETIYNLKNMSDNKLAIIVANFDRALQCLMEMDIGFDDFINDIFGFDQEHIADIMLYNFNYNGNFFSDTLKIIATNNNLFSIYVNEIRLKFMGV